MPLALNEAGAGSIGYTHLTRTIEGSLCALLQFNFTWGLVVGIDESGYARRYCYEHQVDATTVEVHN